MSTYNPKKMQPGHNPKKNAASMAKSGAPRGEKVGGGGDSFINNNNSGSVTLENDLVLAADCDYSRLAMVRKAKLRKRVRKEGEGKA